MSTCPIHEIMGLSQKIQGSPLPPPSYCNCEARCNLDSITGHGKESKGKSKGKASVHPRAEESKGGILKISVQRPVSEWKDLQSRKTSYDDYLNPILESQNLFSSNKIPPWHSLTAAQPESVFGDEEEDPAAEAQKELQKNKEQAGYVPHFDSWVSVTHDQKNMFNCAGCHFLSG